MIRSFALMVGAVSLAVAATAAQAAPPRMATPAGSESEELGGSPFLLPIVLAILAGLVIVLLTDGEEPQSP